LHTIKKKKIAVTKNFNVRVKSGNLLRYVIKCTV